MKKSFRYKSKLKGSNGIKKNHIHTFAERTKNLQKGISITAITSISALGNSLEDSWLGYDNEQHLFRKKTIGGHSDFVAELSPIGKHGIEVLRNSNDKYRSLDDSVLFAMYVSQKAIKLANWEDSSDFGVNIGSSRGATRLFETYHQDFLDEGHAKTLSSPTTTLGNISSWVAHDLQTMGPTISHSITCSTALHAMLNGIAWITSGMCDRFLVGGSEAPLTPFTIAQMKALKIYAATTMTDYPSRAADPDKKHNTMVLGEGASMACLERGQSENSMASVKGFGYATEILKHSVSISANANCFQRSMLMALGELRPNEVDVIVTHSPGTVKGDMAEYNAIQKVFGKKGPSLTNNKWKIGHTLGASGMLNIEMAVLMLQKQEFIEVPFIENETPKRLKNILVNAVGFGGNAVSVLLSN